MPLIQFNVYFCDYLCMLQKAIREHSALVWRTAPTIMLSRTPETGWHCGRWWLDRGKNHNSALCQSWRHRGFPLIFIY